MSIDLEDSIIVNVPKPNVPDAPCQTLLTTNNNNNNTISNNLNVPKPNVMMTLEELLAPRTSRENVLQLRQFSPGLEQGSSGRPAG